jgi:hypothetical protein
MRTERCTDVKLTVALCNFANMLKGESVGAHNISDTSACFY